MNERKKTNAERNGLRRRIAELEASEAEQKRMEEALRRSEERYRAVTETAFAGIGITDPDENMVFVNPAFVQMLGYTQEELEGGYTQEELEGMNLSRLTNPEEFARYQKFTQQRKEGVENHYETRIYRSVNAALTLSEHTVLSQKIDLCVRLKEDLPRVVADPTELEQVVLNLFNNAVDAMPDGGRLSVTTSAEHGWVCLRVEDTGMGIPDGDLHRVFDPFFTTKQVGEGTGLGLSVSYGIIQKMGGRIEVQSNQGRGTTFTVMLPVQRG